MMKDTEALDIYVPKAVPPATDVRTGLVRSGFWTAMRLSTYRSGENGYAGATRPKWMPSVVMCPHLHFPCCPDQGLSVRG